RTRPLDHARGLRYRGPRRLPGPDSHRQAALNLSLPYVMSTIPSSWRRSSLGALAQRKSEIRDLLDSAAPLVQGHPVDNAENSNWNYTINPNRRLLSRLEDHDRNLPALRMAL